VLLLARRHIENLEREKRGLEGRNGVLVEDMENLKGVWVSMGGPVLPWFLGLKLHKKRKSGANGLQKRTWTIKFWRSVFSAGKGSKPPSL
jgi:hypothetical protein